MTVNRLKVRWKPQADDDITKNITQRDQFSSEKVDLTEALIREAFQNILDAGAPERTGPIRVRLSFTKAKPTSSPFLDGLLLQLAPHLRGCGVQIADGDLTNPTFLVVEDFSTTGLTGAVDRYDEDRWNGFFRSVGASQKRGASGGRWGLGKLVFTFASSVGTIFALTVRHDDASRTPLLMGQTILKTHAVDGIRYGTHGFLALPGKDGTIQLPCRDEEVIARFREEAGIARTVQPGLSIAVVLPAEVVREELLGFLLQNYFFPILDGQLVVDVDGIEVSDQTFDEMVERYGGEDLNTGHMARFVRQLGLVRQEEPLVVAPADWYDRPNLGLTDPSAQALRNAYKAGEIVVARFPIFLKERTGQDHETYVDVAVQKTGNGGKGGAVVVRNLITVPDEAKRIRLDGSFVALLAQHDPVVAFLGDAEGPAHVDWNTRAQRLNSEWRSAGPRLSRVRAAPRRLIELLAPAIDEEDPDALIEELSVERELQAARLPPHKAEKDVHGGDNGISPLPPSPQKWRLERRAGGFSISSGPGLGESDLPLSLRVRAAFDVPAGDPFKRHHKFDFDLDNGSDIDVKEEGAAVVAEDANTVVVTAEAALFRVTFDGFDTRRDLVVEARKIAR